MQLSRYIQRSWSSPSASPPEENPEATISLIFYMSKYHGYRHWDHELLLYFSRVNSIQRWSGSVTYSSLRSAFASRSSSLLGWNTVSGISRLTVLLSEVLNKYHKTAAMAHKTYLENAIEKECHDTYSLCICLPTHLPLCSLNNVSGTAPTCPAHRYQIECFENAKSLSLSQKMQGSVEASGCEAGAYSWTPHLLSRLAGIEDKILSLNFIWKELWKPLFGNMSILFSKYREMSVYISITCHTPFSR